MPAYRLSDKEARELTLFLETLRWEEADHQRSKKGEPFQRPNVSHGAGPEEAESGRRLIMKSNCVGCHEIKGIKNGERGPAWDGIASRPLRKFDFGENPDQVEMSKAAWIKAKILKPRSFRDSLKMPNLDISEEDATAITTALLGLTDKKIPKKYVKKDKGTAVPPVRIPTKGPVGKLWKELQCRRCHTVGGAGGNIGPELAFEGSRVKHDWLVRYLEKPEPIRPISAARMPDLKLSKQEAALLSDFIRMSLVDDELPVDIVPEGKISKKTYKRGKKLFSRKYGCLGCHQVNGRGGKIGPDLSSLGNRLQGDWVYAYLKNPQSVIPDAMMPNFALKDEDAMALTEYLLSLGADVPKRGEISANTKEKVTGGKR